MKADRFLKDILEVSCRYFKDILDYLKNFDSESQNLLIWRQNKFKEKWLIFRWYSSNSNYDKNMKYIK